MLQPRVVAKYGAKLPFYRLAQMQESCGVPVSESAMSERSEQVADRALPVYLALKQEAANGEVIHTDDTPVLRQNPIRPVFSITSSGLSFAKTSSRRQMPHSWSHITPVNMLYSNSQYEN
jgi:hypothetical protein